VDDSDNVLRFVGMQGFKAKMAADAAGVQGSGWAWLGYSKERDAVQVVTTANQDPCITTGLIPLLGIDVRSLSDLALNSVVFAHCVSRL
jgi:superoxide dismutase